MTASSRRQAHVAINMRCWRSNNRIRSGLVCMHGYSSIERDIDARLVHAAAFNAADATAPLLQGSMHVFALARSNATGIYSGDHIRYAKWFLVSVTTLTNSPSLISCSAWFVSVHVELSDATTSRVPILNSLRQTSDS
uniref:Uncharacterized protein n=1 Tax=Arundo donax TaxID=35708 RepID=A0A0A9SX66_ARUDO